jgi:hypothetical protein
MSLNRQHTYRVASNLVAQHQATGFSLAQSFSPFLAQDGRQVRRPSWIWATNLCYILLNKFVALVGSGRRTYHPSCDEKGLKDWAIVCVNRPNYQVIYNQCLLQVTSSLSSLCKKCNVSHRIKSEYKKYYISSW